MPSTSNGAADFIHLLLRGADILAGDAVIVGVGPAVAVAPQDDCFLTTGHLFAGACRHLCFCCLRCDCLGLKQCGHQKQTKYTTSQDVLITGHGVIKQRRPWAVQKPRSTWRRVFSLGRLDAPSVSPGRALQDPAVAVLPPDRCRSPSPASQRPCRNICHR